MSNAAAVVRVRTNDGCRVAVLCKTGTKLAHLVWIESGGVRATRQPKDILRKAQYLDYPLAKAVKGMLTAGKSLGITKAGSRLLKDAVKRRLQIGTD
jgi:hypothetical protein